MVYTFIFKGGNTVAMAGQQVNVMQALPTPTNVKESEGTPKTPARWGTVYYHVPC